MIRPSPFVFTTVQLGSHTNLIQLLAACLLLLLTSCGPTVLYEKVTPTETDQGWAYTDTLSFQFTVTDNQQLYDMELVVQHSEEFAYENFYLNIHTTGPNGIRTTERISLDLSGEFGAWNGDCSGGRCELAVPVLQRTRFQEVGDYKLVLEQNSRDNPLAAIQAMGVRVVEVE